MNKKVLFCINTLNKAGAEVVLVNIANRLVELDFEVDIAVLFKEGELINSLSPKINIIPILSGYKLDKTQKRLRQLNYFRGEKYWKKKYADVINKKYDVEIAFLEGPSFLFISNSINDNSKKVGWIHIELDQHAFKVNKRLFNESLEKFSSLVFVSDYIKYKFLESRPHLREKSITIYNFLEKNEIINRSFHLNNNITFKKDKINLLCVGRLSYQKGFDRLLDACSKLKREGFEFYLHILGRGPDEKKLNKLSTTLGLSENVLFHGFIENPYPIMAQADLFILPSRYEGFGLVVVESAILGVPVLVTNIPGPAELVEKFNIGWISESNEGSLFTSLKELLADDSLVKSKREELKLEFWNEDEILKELILLLERS